MSSERDELLAGIQTALRGDQDQQAALPADAATIRDVQAKPDHLRTQDERAGLAAAQQRAMADLLRKPNDTVTPGEKAAIQVSVREWLQGDRTT